MPGLSQAEQVATLDARFPLTGATDHIAYSQNGTSESALIARTPIGATGWAAATNATPSVKANTNALTSAGSTGASGANPVSHFAIMSAATGGTQRTDWQAIPTPIPVITGSSITWAVGAAAISLD